MGLTLTYRDGAENIEELAVDDLIIVLERIDQNSISFYLLDKKLIRHYSSFPDKDIFEEHFIYPKNTPQPSL